MFSNKSYIILSLLLLCVFISVQYIDWGIPLNAILATLVHQKKHLTLHQSKFEEKTEE